MGFGQLISRVLRRQAYGVVAVPVPVVGRELSAEDSLSVFVPNQVYLEVRIRQMWLTDERELWREYAPFVTVVSEFLCGGRRVEVPTVLGSPTHCERAAARCASCTSRATRSSPNTARNEAACC